MFCIREVSVQTLSSIFVTEAMYFLSRQYGVCRKPFWFFVTRWCSSTGLLLPWSLAEAPGSPEALGCLLFCKINFMILVCSFDCLSVLGLSSARVTELSTCFSVAVFSLSLLAHPKQLVHGCDLLYCSHNRHCSWIWPYFRPLLLIRSLFRAWRTPIMTSCFFIKDSKAFSWPGVLF